MSDPLVRGELGSQGVYLIRFALVCVDEAHFARIGYHYLMATLLKYPANPG
jgi:hypothetical protein